MVLIRLFSTHAYGHLTNGYICQHTVYLSVMLDHHVIVCRGPFPVLEIFRLTVPDSDYVWPWDKIRCQMHIFSTKSIWKEEKGLGHTLQNLEILYKDTFRTFILQMFHWASKQCLIRGSKLSSISANNFLSHWWINLWCSSLLRIWQ